ncbi:MAG: methyltransferase type 12 [Flavobacteriales bacterium]|nr:MAG: methyltransferase type 12 [Flavobacteriales bacterium]
MPETDKKQLTEFYDKYVNHQLRHAYNVRHFILFDELLKLGLKDNSNVLELGCGIGVSTSMIAAYANNGTIIGIDISPKSIEAAKEKVKFDNVSFIAADILEIEHTSKHFDFITLFDVLEHVPLDSHELLFERLAKHSNQHTKILINIPNPAFIEYLSENEPKKLQVIDQPVWANQLLTVAYRQGLVLKQFRTYDIWTEEDYQLMLFQKKTLYKKAELATSHWQLKSRIRKLLGLK